MSGDCAHEGGGDEVEKHSERKEEEGEGKTEVEGKRGRKAGYK